MPRNRPMPSLERKPQVLKPIIIAMALCGATHPALAQQAPPSLLAGACQGCHGATGAGAQGIPAILRTMSAPEFVTAMQEFQGNRRPATVMGRIARGYTEGEITALAALYARPEAGR